MVEVMVIAPNNVQSSLFNPLALGMAETLLSLTILSAVGLKDDPSECQNSCWSLSVGSCIFRIFSACFMEKSESNHFGYQVFSKTLLLRHVR